MYPRIPVVYMLHNNINGKFYIGSTFCLKDRLKFHRRGFAVKPQHPLYVDIHHYGWSAFSVVVLEQCEASNLRSREKYYIESMDACVSGYNQTTATTPGEWLSQMNYSNWSDDEYRAQKGRDSSALQLERLKDASYRASKSEDLKRYTDSIKKPVAMSSLSGELVRTFGGAREAGRWLNESGVTSSRCAGSSVSNICSGKDKFRKTLYGYKWSYIARD